MPGEGVLRERLGSKAVIRLCSLLYFTLRSWDFILRAVVTLKNFKQ